MKFHKETDDIKSTPISDSGEFELSSMEGIVKYGFDYKDNTLRLEIDDMWLDGEDIDSLISFLQFAKTQLAK